MAERTQKYNILYLDHGAKPVGGGQVNTLSLIKGLDKSVFNPIIVSSRENVFTEEARNNGVRVEIINYPDRLTSTYRNKVTYEPVAVLKNIFSLMRLVKELCQFIRSNRIDLVHPCDNISRIAVGIAAKIENIPAVCHITDDLEDTITNRILRKGILLCMDYIMPVSDKVGSFFRISGRSSGKVITVYTGIDLDYFMGSNSDSTLRSEFSIGSDVTVIGIIGLLISIKGHRELFQSLKLLKQGNTPPFCCVVVGDGPEFEALRHLTIELGFSNEIVFAGFRKDIANLLNALYYVT